LGDAAGAGRIKNGQSNYAFREIEHESGESAAAAEQESNEQDAHILYSERDWRERHQRDRNVSAEGEEQAGANHECDLTSRVERAFLRGEDLGCGFGHCGISRSEFMNRSLSEAARGLSVLGVTWGVLVRGMRFL
jgi:hypothetical protein